MILMTNEIVKLIIMIYELFFIKKTKITNTNLKYMTSVAMTSHYCPIYHTLPLLVYPTPPTPLQPLKHARCLKCPYSKRC